ncbi:hypothetical protein BDI4_580076 [Burkholderia diffusa]|nr:hypothetical protein BDI4_580076 [Burkholderia diffusa]
MVVLVAAPTPSHREATQLLSVTAALLVGTSPTLWEPPQRHPESMRQLWGARPLLPE